MTRPETGTALKRFKQALKWNDLTSKGYKKIIEEAIQVIDSLENAKVTPSSLKAGKNEENSAIAKILQ